MFETIWNYIPKKTIIGLITGSAIYGALAVDTAGDHLSKSEAVELKNQGAELFIQALTWWPKCGLPTSQPSVRVENLTNARSAGLRIAGYFLVDPYTSGREAVNRAKEGIPQDVWDDLEFVALDYEIPLECRPQSNVSLFTVLEALSYLKDLGKPAVVYTNYDNWVNVLGNPIRPSGSLLWNASWDGDPDFDYPKQRYGGWEDDEVILEQYGNDSDFAGVFVDFNSIRYQPVPVTEPTWNGRCWMQPDGFCWEPGSAIWYGLNGEPLWGPCLSWNGRKHIPTGVRVHQLTPVFHQYWSTAPSCGTT